MLDRVSNFFHVVSNVLFARALGMPITHLATGGDRKPQSLINTSTHLERNFCADDADEHANFVSFVVHLVL